MSDPTPNPNVAAALDYLQNALRNGARSGGMYSANCQAALDEAHALLHKSTIGRHTQAVADILKAHPESVGLRESIEYLAKALDEEART